MTAVQLKSQQLSIEQIDFLPQSVYKYRECKNPTHMTILTERQVWFAQPSSFTDPFDCKNPLRYDLLTEKDIYNKYLSASKDDHPNWVRQQHREFARDWTKKSPMKNNERLKEFAKESFTEFDCRFGVLSLTTNPKSSRMWTEYSAGHTGFCIGYNPKIAFKLFGGGGEVQYLDELPIIMPTPIHDREFQHSLQVFSKQMKWSYEEEYRVHKFQPEPATVVQRTITLPIDSYTEIIFGAKIDPQDRNDIIDIARNTFPNAKLLQARLTENGEITITTEIEIPSC